MKNGTVVPRISSRSSYEISVPENHPDDPSIWSDPLSLPFDSLSPPESFPLLSLLQELGDENTRTQTVEGIIQYVLASALFLRTQEQEEMFRALNTVSVSWTVSQLFFLSSLTKDHKKNKEKVSGRTCAGCEWGAREGDGTQKDRQEEGGWKECTKRYKKANRHQGLRVIQMSISSSGIIIHCQAGDNGLEKPEGLGGFEVFARDWNKWYASKIHVTPYFSWVLFLWRRTP